MVLLIMERESPLQNIRCAKKTVLNTHPYSDKHLAQVTTYARKFRFARSAPNITVGMQLVGAAAATVQRYLTPTVVQMLINIPQCLRNG
jgi:dihydrodipicolinate reductase